MTVTCGTNTFCLNLVNIIETTLWVCFEIEMFSEILMTMQNYTS